MKIGIFSVKDVTAGEFQVPFMQPRVEMALRAFKTEVNRAADNNMAYLYPEEYELFQLGVMDQDTGKIETGDGPVRLAGGKDVKNKSG